MSHRIVFVTTGSREEAESIATAVVSEGLAACVNIVDDVTSIYEWKGKVERDRECKMLIKTHEARVEALMARIVELHSYDICEVTVVPVVAGNPDYLAWIDAQVGV